jgi:hypothetical protein
MGIEPDQSQLFVPPPKGFGHSGHRADRNGVVAAEDERSSSAFVETRTNWASRPQASDISARYLA